MNAYNKNYDDLDDSDMVICSSGSWVFSEAVYGSSFTIFEASLWRWWFMSCAVLRMVYPILKWSPID